MIDNNDVNDEHQWCKKDKHPNWVNAVVGLCLGVVHIKVQRAFYPDVSWSPMRKNGALNQGCARDIVW